MRSLLNRIPAFPLATALFAAGALIGCMESTAPAQNELAVAAAGDMAPVITVQPPARTAKTSGQLFAIGVTATGTPTLKYAWQKCDFGTCVNIPFANGPTYSRYSLYRDTSTYRCKISNAYGSVTSRESYNSAQELALQAENGTLTGAVVSSAEPGYTGTGYILFPHLSGGSVSVKATVGIAGSYLLFVHYASITPHSLKVEVNGVVVNPNWSLEITGSYSDWYGFWTRVPLNAGTNTIKATTLGWGGPHIDKFGIL